jgi:hypothetical protein
MEWSENEFQSLMELRAQGLSWGEVAEAMANEYSHREYTPNACKKKYHNEREPDEELLQEAVHLEAEPSQEPSNADEDDGIRVGCAWTEDEMVLLHALKISGYSYKQCAHVLSTFCGRREYNENVCKKKWNSTDWDVFLSDRKSRQQIKDQASQDEYEKQRIIEDTLTTQSKIVRREQSRTDVIVDRIKSAIYRLPKPKQRDLVYVPRHHEYSDEHMAVMLSDLHVGAKYTLAETGGLGEYNVDIFNQRMRRLRDSVIEIAQRHRHMYDIPELHVFCLGDVVAGENESGAWSHCYIDLDIFDQMIAGFAALRDAVSCWSTAFQKVTFYGVIGNHGRVGTKGSQKYHSNWDRVCYSFVEESLKDHQNIVFKIPQTWWLSERILNHRFFISHGDGIKGSLGVPYYGVERAQSRVSGLLPEKPDYTLIGHFHSVTELSTNFGKVLMNGSFMGGDMYSIKELFRADRPEQKIFGMHHKKGVTWSYNIHLDEE